MDLQDGALSRPQLPATRASPRACLRVLAPWRPASPSVLIWETRPSQVTHQPGHTPGQRERSPQRTRIPSDKEIRRGQLGGWPSPRLSATPGPPSFLRQEEASSLVLFLLRESTLSLAGPEGLCLLGLESGTLS